jgi:hypothetical protein
MCEKNKITQKLKNQLWNLHFKEDQDKCKCCNINNINKTNYVVGHIYPEICGGKLDIYNLLPICKYCNNKMGQQYLLTYAKNNNYQIILDDNYNNYQNKIKQLDFYGIKFNSKSTYLLNKIDLILTYLLTNNYIDINWNKEKYDNKEIILSDQKINNIHLEFIHLKYNLLDEKIFELWCRICEKETELLRGWQYKMFIYLERQSKKNYKLKNYNIFVELYFANVK